MVVTACTVVRSFLTGQTVWLTSYAGLVQIIFEIAFRTLLQTDAEIEDSNVSGRAGQAAVRIGTGACLARFVTHLTYTFGVGEAPGRTCPHAVPVHPVVPTRDTLRGSGPEAALVVALVVATVLGLLVIFVILQILPNYRLLAVQRRHTLFGVRCRERVDVRKIVEILEDVGTEKIIGHLGYWLRGSGREERTER